MRLRTSVLVVMLALCPVSSAWGEDAMTAAEMVQEYKRTELMSCATHLLRLIPSTHHTPESLAEELLHLLEHKSTSESFGEILGRSLTGSEPTGESEVEQLIRLSGPSGSYTAFSTLSRMEQKMVRKDLRNYSFFLEKKNEGRCMESDVKDLFSYTPR